jgi:hypothetical protein
MPTTQQPNTTLNKTDLLWITRRLPKHVNDILHQYQGRVGLAGGFIRACIAREDVSDIDLFAQDKQMAEIVANALASHPGCKKRDSDNAFTIFGMKHVVQVIHRWTFNSMTDIIPSFDFTIARAAVWVEGGMWVSECDADFYSDLAAKRLVYRLPDRNEDAGGSILRVLKFYQRGYTIPLDSLGEVIARTIKDVDYRRIEIAFNTGEERVFETARVITGLLREVDPLHDPDFIYTKRPSTHILVNDTPNPLV